jgi:hypothetical protein
VALAFVAASTPVFGTTVANPTATPTLPAGTASGDRVYIVCASKPSGTAITGTTGWTSLSASVLGGTIRVTVLARTYDGVWTMPTLAVVGTTTTGAIGASAATYRPDSGYEITGESVTTGTDTTSGTGFSATGAANLSITAGDGLLALTGVSPTTADGVITATTPTLTATSATLGTVTERADAGSANGADSSVKIHEALVTAGTSSAAPVHALTLSAASTGGTVFVRVRQTLIPPFTIRGEASNAMSGSGAGTLSTTTPAGTQIGDTILLIHMSDFFTIGNLGTPTGTAVTTWAEHLAARRDGGTNGEHIKVWLGTATAAGAQTVIANSGPSFGDEVYQQIIVFAGSMVIEYALPETKADAATWVASGVSPTSSASVYVLAGLNGGDADSGYTFPGSMTALTERDSGFCTMRTGYEFLAASGPSGTRTITIVGATRPGAVINLALAPPVPTGVQVRASSKVTAIGSVSSTAAPVPAGTTTGDVAVLIGFCDMDGALANLTTPSGFAQAGSSSPGGASTPRGKVWWKATGGSEGSTWTVPQDTGASSVVIALTFTGVDTTTPFDVLPSWSEVTAAASQVAPAITPGATAAATGALVCAWATQSTVGTRSYTPPGGMIEAQDADSGFLAGSAATLLAPTTTPGTKTATYAATATDKYLAVSFAMNPTGGAAPTVTLQETHVINRARHRAACW